LLCLYTISRTLLTPFLALPALPDRISHLSHRDLCMTSTSRSSIPLALFAFSLRACTRCLACCTKIMPISRLFRLFSIAIPSVALLATGLCPPPGPRCLFITLPLVRQPPSSLLLAHLLHPIFFKYNSVVPALPAAFCGRKRPPPPSLRTLVQPPTPRCSIPIPSRSLTDTRWILHAGLPTPDGGPAGVVPCRVRYAYACTTHRWILLAISFPALPPTRCFLCACIPVTTTLPYVPLATPSLRVPLCYCDPRPASVSVS